MITFVGLVVSLVVNLVLFVRLAQLEVAKADLSYVISQLTIRRS